MKECFCLCMVSKNVKVKKEVVKVWSFLEFFGVWLLCLLVGCRKSFFYFIRDL